jgi:hypothetical protein
MFLALNRVVKAVICACWLWVAWLGWQQRERLQPALDLVQIWVERDSDAGKDAVRLTGTVTDITGETSFHLRESDGKIWHCGFVGLSGVLPGNRLATAPETRLARETRTNLQARLAGRQVAFDATVTTPLRSAMGVLRINGTNVNLALVGDGRVQLDRAAIRGLPVMEQHALVTAERHAKKATMGRWSLDTSTPGSMLSPN